MSYNTKLVRKADLPKKWEDLLTNPRWKARNLALGNRPQLWAANLWGEKGEGWTGEFLRKLFTEVKPQLRKEGMGALPQLVAAGEIHAAIPSNHKRSHQLASEGAPIGFACPEPVPASAADAVILKGAPNLYAAKVHLNWLLSTEGQIAQYAAGDHTPIHPQLRRSEFLPFAEEILGKQEAFLDKTLENEIVAKVEKLWNDLWLKGSRKKP